MKLYFVQSVWDPLIKNNTHTTNYTFHLHLSERPLCYPASLWCLLKVNIWILVPFPLIRQRACTRAVMRSCLRLCLCWRLWCWPPLISEGWCFSNERQAHAGLCDCGCVVCYCMHTLKPLWPQTSWKWTLHFYFVRVMYISWGDIVNNVWLFLLFHF